MKALELTRIMWFSLTLVALSAQTPLTAASAPPSGPLVAKTAPDFAQWTVMTQYNVSGTTGGAAPTPGGNIPPTGDKPAKQSVIKVVKTGDIRHVSLVRENGTKSENWCVGDMQVITCPEWPLPVLSTGERKGDSSRVDFSRGDFTGFDWISAKSFAGIRKIGANDCMFFQDSVAMDAVLPVNRFTNDNGGISAEAVKFPPVATIACVDLKTRLPVSVQWGNVLMTYTFDPPPSAKLSLPPELQAVIDNWLAIKKRNMHVPVHP